MSMLFAGVAFLLLFLVVASHLLGDGPHLNFLAFSLLFVNKAYLVYLSKKNIILNSI